jgi:hypothetical protein
MQPTLLARLDELDARVAEHVAAIHATAQAAPPGGGHAWDRLLAFYGVAPDDARDRVGQVQRLSIERGAVPGEVCRALTAMVQRADGALRGLVAGVPTEPRASALSTRLARIVAEEGARYEASLRRRQVASVFANAATTSKQTPWANRGVDAPLVLSCPACGAPQERALDFQCRYCHAPMTR